jgi:hypothetical protein
MAPSRESPATAPQTLPKPPEDHAATGGSDGMPLTRGDARAADLPLGAFLPLSRHGRFGYAADDTFKGANGVRGRRCPNFTPGWTAAFVELDHRKVALRKGYAEASLTTWLRPTRRSHAREES